MWELYPHIEEVFSLMFSFRLSSPPSLMVVTQERMGVARNDPEHSTYSIEMYHLADQSKLASLRLTLYHLSLSLSPSLPPNPPSLSSSLFPASYTGQAEDSHTDTITALDASPKLKLFASCSKDCTVRIWTEDNHPVRYYHLHDHSIPLRLNYELKSCI